MRHTTNVPKVSVIIVMGTSSVLGGGGGGATAATFSFFAGFSADFLAGGSLISILGETGTLLLDLPGGLPGGFPVPLALPDLLVGETLLPAEAFSLLAELDLAPVGDTDEFFGLDLFVPVFLPPGVGVSELFLPLPLGLTGTSTVLDLAVFDEPLPPEVFFCLGFVGGGNESTNTLDSLTFKGFLTVAFGVLGVEGLVDFLAGKTGMDILGTGGSGMGEEGGESLSLDGDGGRIVFITLKKGKKEKEEGKKKINLGVQQLSWKMLSFASVLLGKYVK